MLWFERLGDSYLKLRKDNNRPILIRDEKTASGRVHIGSMRGVVIHGILSEYFSDNSVENKFLYEINDFDPMDGLPTYLDPSFSEHMGKPLCEIPSPDGIAKNYAEYFAEEFMGVIAGAGFKPEFYRSSELYKSGKMNDCIKLALEKADIVRKIYFEVSGSKRENDWLPLNVICPSCGKVSTTKVTSFDGKEVEFHCRNLEWTKGCGYSGKISPYDGRAKLPWKLEWPAKWKVVGVDIEGGGKDHSTRGGSRDVANRIAREVFDIEPPFDVPYEFFLVGGKKMSSSKGFGASSKEVSDIVPSTLFRLMFLAKDINQAINFDPSGDTVPVLFDNYDRLHEAYFNDKESDDAKLYSYIHSKEDRGNLKNRFLPRFSLVAFLVQMPHMDVYEELSKVKGSQLTKDDKDEIDLRAKYAKDWLNKYAADEFKFEIQYVLPESAKNLNDSQKNGLKEILNYLEKTDKLDGQELHTVLHNIRKDSGIDAKQFFEAIYISTLGKDSGPKAGWFLSVLDRDFLIKRFKEVVQ